MDKRPEESFYDETYQYIFDRQDIPKEDRRPANFFFDNDLEGHVWAIPAHTEYDHKTYLLLDNGAIISPDAVVANLGLIGSRAIVMGAKIGNSTIGQECVIHDDVRIKNLDIPLEIARKLAKDQKLMIV